VNRKKLLEEGLSITEAEKLTEMLTRSACGPSRFHEVLQRANELRERSQPDFAEEMNKRGRKMRGERE
jgi:hypothetical protein